MLNLSSKVKLTSLLGELEDWKLNLGSKVRLISLLGEL